MCGHIEEMQRGDNEERQRREGDHHRHGGGEWEERWWISWNTALLWYADDGVGHWKREKQERMG